MPFNEHTAILKPKNNELRTRRTRGSCGHKIAGAVIPENVAVFWNISENHGEPYEIRFPVNNWSEADARVWLRENKVKYESFSPAESRDEKSPCYNFVNVAEDTLEIDIHGFIGDEFEDNDSKSFRSQLKNAGNPSTIKVNINSNGGFHSAGVAINNSLREHPAKVITNVSGIAASAAATIFAAGDERHAPSNTTLMIHKPSVPFMIGADAEKMRNQAKALDVLQEGIVATLSKAMDRNAEQINKMLNDETWFTAEKALETGLVTKVTDEVEITDFHDFSDKRLNYYNAVPDVVLNSYDINHGESRIEVELENSETSLEKIVNYCKKYFVSLKSEEPSMPLNKEIQDAINEAVSAATSELTQKVETVEAENKSLKTENASLSAAVSQVTEALNNKEIETKNNKHRELCEKLVNKGKMRPADVETHVETLADKIAKDESEFTDEKKETPRYTAYVEFLNSLPVIVPVEDRHVANKDGAPQKMTDDQIDEAVNKIMTENKITYAAALERFGKENPGVEIQ